ncbi:MAG: F0F1 ATP synthase subunit B [Prevotellaceae bacterium]|jgi:F-type H+-transporting ATPase subunit b|nr:F0F1 ATP synthase subunit B [Prevotellaceae bacterium]
MNLLTPDIGLLFWMLLCFGVVFFVLAKFGFPVIVKMVEERKNFIDNSVSSAKEANERLKGIVQEGEQILKKSHSEEIRILKEADDMRHKIIAEAKEQAKVDAGKIFEDAKIAIKKEKEKALKDINNQVAELSISIAEKILRKNLSEQQEQQEFVNQLIAEVNN